jgi:soluble lytic murein transglycosylase
MKRHLLPQILTGVAALSALAGCNLGASPEAPVTYVIITDAPEVLALTGTPMPDGQPVPTLTPIVVNQTQADAPVQSQTVPTPQPDTAEPTRPIPTPVTELSSSTAPSLEDAHALAHDGYYDEARAAYLPLSSTNPEAAEGYAILALREGDFEDALSVLTAYLNANAENPEAAQAYFLRGEANLGVARWTSAVNDYRQYLRLRPGLIDSYVHERIGDAFFALNMTADALASYDSAIATLRARVQLAALRERAAQVYRAAGQPAQAAAIYDSIAAEAANRAYKATIELAAAAALRESGDDSAATVRYQNILDTYVDVPAAAIPALGALEELGATVSDYTKGRAYSFAEDYAAAIEAFNAYTTSVTLDQIPAELHLFLGRAYRAVGNTPAALVAFRTVVEQYPTHALFGEALLEEGRTYFMGGDTAEAIRTYLSIAQTYPNLDATAAEALWRAGYLHNEAGQFAEALNVFEQLAAAYPVSEQAVSGLSIAASAALNAGDTGTAERLFRQLAESSTSTTSADAYLQVAKLAQARGMQDVARQAFTAAITAAPDSFAAARSRDYLSGTRMFQQPASRAYPPGDPSADQATAESWLRQTFGIPAETQLAVLPPGVTDDARYKRGRELWALGLYPEAENELLDLLEAYTEDGAVSYALSLDFKALGAYYPSQQAAANLIAAAEMGTLDVPAFIGRLRYPTPYLNLVLAESERRDIDPLLMFSLIRHESLFDTYATAAAGEKGLMQVIPPTADYIAGLLNWPDYDHADLFKPYAGIAFGAAYIDEQLDRFGNDPVPALAGYNAGPGRAITWREAAGTDPDAFIDAISIASTRGYVQRIYTFYTIYRALYGAG